MYRTNLYENLVIARLFDFFASVNQWHRRAWEPGTLMMIRELLEASEARNQSVLSEGALAYVKSSVMPITGKDKGIGSNLTLGKLSELVKTPLQFRNYDYFQLKVILESIEERYLENWSEALKNTASCPAPERTARAIGGHLLDLDFHPDYLHRWLNYLVKHDPAKPSLTDIIADADRLTKESLKTFMIFIPFEQAIGRMKNTYENILNAATFTAELARAGISPGPKHYGGLKLEITSRDIYTAVEKAGEWVDSLTARVTVGLKNKRLNISSKAWIEGEADSYPLRRNERSVELHELDRNKQLVIKGEPHIIDAAIELLAPMAFSSPSSALIGGWAAIEGLLGTPGEDRGANAGDRMAAIVTCSFPRAELTKLSYAVDNTTAEWAALEGCRRTYERINLLAQFIKDGVALRFPAPEDQAAFERMRVIIADPKKKLHDVEDHLKRVFRRMYRLRNLILHWGKTDAVGLRAGVRTTAPLVGEGMDRIVHAYFKNQIEPLELAAFAKVGISKVNSDDVTSITGLLG